MKTAYTIRDFGTEFQIGRTRVYEEIGSGRLRTYRVGRRRFISPDAITHWRSNLEHAEQQRMDKRLASRAATAAK